MIRDLSRFLVLCAVVAASGGGPTLAAAVHEAAHQSFAHDLDHHDLDHHDLDHHGTGADSESPTVDGLEPDHSHADADQVRSSGPADIAPPVSRSPVVVVLKIRRLLAPPDRIVHQDATAARPPTRAPPAVLTNTRPTIR